MKDQILACLPPDHPWRDTIDCHAAIGSTNTQAKALAAQGAPEGTVVIADMQTGGRGRLGRSFHSPAGLGLYMSVILRPQRPATELMHLTCAVAVAACDAVAEVCGFRPGIKWINDLVAHGKKLAGILTELSIGPDGLVQYAVVGIGVNVGQQDFPEGLQDLAISAAMASGRPIDRSALAAAMICRLEKLDLADRPGILERYRRQCVTLGRPVTVIQGDRRWEATALSVDQEGGLVVRRCDGTVETVQAGEVSVRGLAGYI